MSAEERRFVGIVKRRGGEARLQRLLHNLRDQVRRMEARNEDARRELEVVRMRQRPVEELLARLHTHD